MRLKDYGCGKPLTARRILAVKAAIDNLGRKDVFDKGASLLSANGRQEENYDSRQRNA